MGKGKKGSRDIECEMMLVGPGNRLDRWSNEMPACAEGNFDVDEAADLNYLSVLITNFLSLRFSMDNMIILKFQVILLSI